MRQALRAGKRAHTETGIDRAGQSVVSATPDLPGGAADAGADCSGRTSITGRAALVIGAGAIGSLALATLRRAGAGPLYVTSRSAKRPAGLAARHDAQAAPAPNPSTVDIPVSATASGGGTCPERPT